jgi:exopolysaccharide biosynthesis WecB/TagA/CpsF family protein
MVVGGIPVDILGRAQWADLLLDHWREKRATGCRPKVVTTANGQVVSLFGSDRAFREAMLRADHVAADGMSVVVGSRLRPGGGLPERVATTDWFHDAARVASAAGLRFYMLGAGAEALERAQARVRALYPDLVIAGAHHGYFADTELEAVAERISASRADVLWLGLGNPRQLLVAHRLAELVPSLTWVRTCGGLFDFLSGDRPRAPLALQKAGLEWAYRLANDPRRLFWRYATTNIHSTILMVLNTRAPRGG